MRRLGNCSSDIFIGVTSSNSSMFLGACLESVIRTTEHFDARIVVLDNASEDGSAEIARKRGAEVVSKRCSQGDALNELLRRSRSQYTLLIHADVVLLSDRWVMICRKEIGGDVVLVSPEDIGCGPLTRPFGRGKPESSFLFFETKRLRRLRSFGHTGGGRFGFRRVIDFYGPHITHRLPEQLARRGLGWTAMNVLYSDATSNEFFSPKETDVVWTPELGHMRYGLGNFYSLSGTITHYHNWYDRFQGGISWGTKKPVGRRMDFPLEFVKQYSERFLKDYRSGQLVLPSPLPVPREPKSL